MHLSQRFSSLIISIIWFQKYWRLITIIKNIFVYNISTFILFRSNFYEIIYIPDPIYPFHSGNKYALQASFWGLYLIWKGN